ncbi:MAG: CotH kinase family protein, partial [Bacteroidales bacterium]|nr:CotH kinase family protein [Bacteroidales bacterium]
GSTSCRLSDKKSFGIETWDADGNDMDVAFFDFPEEEDYVLMGHIVNLEQVYMFDRTLMYHYLGYQLFSKMGRYSSRTKFIELELNGDYQGLYVFMEKLKRDRYRINISTLNPEDSDPESITGGYILKIDKTAGGDITIDEPLEYFESNWSDDARYTSDISFRSQYDINGELIDFEPYDPPYHSNQYLETYFLYEYPKARYITEVQKNYIQDYIYDFETALLTDDFTSEIRTYTDYIDLGSFVDFFIINEVCRNVDGYRLSTYMYKDRGGKLNMGPIWDLNIGFDSGDRVPFDDWVINYNTFVERDAWMMPFWWPRLLEDPIFRSALKARWTELRTNVLHTDELLGMVDQAVGYLQGNGAVNRNFALWGGGMGIDYNGSIESLKSFLEERTQWMDSEIASF